MKTFFSLFAIIVLSGCATTKMNTPSGQNEVTIHAPVDKVRAQLVAGMVDRGYEIKSSDEFVVVGDRPAGELANVWLGTMANPNVVVRTRANLIPNGADVRVVLRVYLVDGHYSENPQAPQSKTQAWLQRLKAQIEGTPVPPEFAEAPVAAAKSPKAQ